MKLSIIVPCKNEEGNIIDLYNKINGVLKKVKYEVIFIDDGSTDKTLDKLHEIYKNDMVHVKALSFSRNFKKEAAMLAGLEHATGEYTCIIDGDLQQNPEYLLQMMNFLDENNEYDEVAMVMQTRKEGGFISLCKKMFYKIIDKLSDVHFENAASDFRMFRSNVKRAMLSLAEKNRFTKGIFSWVGFNVKYLPYEVEPRKYGKSSFNFKSSMDYAFEGIYAFSTKPLKFALTLGSLFLFSFFAYLIVFIVQLCAFNLKFNVIYIVILLMLLIASLLFYAMGIVGQYIAKMYVEIKNRPVYIVKEKIGFNDDDNIL